MTATWKQLVLDKTGAEDAIKSEQLQSLWSGYGEIFRIQLSPDNLGSLVVKHIAPPENASHPRGWNTDNSNLRKLKSYEVEMYWYQNYSSLCNLHCRVPELTACIEQNNERWIVLEDLDAAGFDLRLDHVTPTHAKACLFWLASFHAQFLNSNPPSSWPIGLWSVGSYWHLQTRPDEYNVMADSKLKQSAHKLDSLLNSCKYKTIIHGDAKLANFCFDHQGKNVAAVDFQYVGGGCGMKDVAYFFSSCFDEDDCQRHIPPLLDYYFKILTTAVDTSTVDAQALEREWRDMFAPAWTDFYRFLNGWMPGHKKVHRYTKELASITLAKL